MTVTALDVAGQSLDLVEKLRLAGPIITPDEAPWGARSSLPSPCCWRPAPCATTPPWNRTRARPGLHAVGDPTEGALVVAAARHGLWKPDLEKLLPRVAEAPFTSERKRMTTAIACRPPAIAPQAAWPPAWRLSSYPAPMPLSSRGRWMASCRSLPGSGRGRYRTAGRRLAPPRRGRQRQPGRQWHARAGRGPAPAGGPAGFYGRERSGGRPDFCGHGRHDRSASQ